VYGSSGPWLVVVPGGPDMPHEYLTRWFQPLARAFRVVLYDPRGRGASKDPSALALYDVTSEAGDLQELFIHLKADKVNVLGHGFGNLVVLRLLQHDSGRVRRVVLSGPPVPVGKDVLAALSRLPERLDGVWRDDYLFVERNGSKFHPTVRNRLLDQALLHAYFMNPEWLPLLPDLHGDPLMRHRLLQAIRGLDLREVLDKSQTPLLVIVSKADVYPEDTLKWYVDLAGRNKAVHLTTFGNSGHFPFIEENGRFTDTVRDFLQ
jgi:pimeloyl-ACP methyl ester carboxylesterase